MLVDIHAKSSLSDDVDLSVAQVLEASQANGFDAVAFCETRSTAYAQRVLDKSEEYEVDVFIGVEIPTDTGLLLGFAPEVDEFYLAETWRRYTDLMRPTPEAVIELFEEIGGTVVAARPYDRGTELMMGDHIFALDGISAVEVVNSRVDRIHNDFAVEAATYLGLPTVGGSDPDGDDIETDGEGGTYFRGEIDGQSSFVEALKYEEFWAVELDDAA